METSKVLSALSYFSVFFAGIIFPLIVWVVASDEIAKGHAKHALISHVIPLIPIPFIFISLYLDVSTGSNDIPILFFISIGITALLGLIVTVWNVIKGVQVLIQTSN